MSRVALAFGVVACIVAAGCYERVIDEDIPFADIPGAVVGGEPASERESLRDDKPARIEPAEAQGRIIENEDGTITLRSASIRALMLNIVYAIDEERPDLFTKHLLSTLTRDEFLERGLDPTLAYEEIVRRERAYRKLLARLPGGQFTPGVFMRPQGKGVYRLAVEPDPSLLWRGLDVRFEKRNWKLRWFVQ